TIKKTQPNVVILELCSNRLSILYLNEKTILEEAKKPSIANMVVQGIMHMSLLSLSAHLTKELGIAPGGEFRKGFQQAKRVPGCVVHLCDRLLNITLMRAISALSAWQKIKLGFGILFNKETVTKKECKQRDLLEE
ncbi:hypothetical protein B4U80_11261, partial [Leptotrombidium deliense]